MLSDWCADSHSVRKLSHLTLASHVLTSEAGIRPSEPCSVSLLATHQTLTNLLLYLMRYFSSFVDSDVKVTTLFDL